MRCPLVLTVVYSTRKMHLTLHEYQDCALNFLIIDNKWEDHGKSRTDNYWH